MEQKYIDAIRESLQIDIEFGGNEKDIEEAREVLEAFNEEIKLS